MQVKWINAAIKGAASVELNGMIGLKITLSCFLFIFGGGFGQDNFIGGEKERGRSTHKVHILRKGFP